MKRYISKILLTGLSLHSFAQSSVWKVTNKDKIVYIGGTVHVLRPEDSPYPLQFERAYTVAEKLIFETDITALQKPDIAQRMLAMAIYQDNRTLQSELDAATYSLLESEFSKLNIPISSFAKFKPSMAVITLTMMKMKEDMGAVAEGVDKTFYNKAVTDGKQIDCLESVDTQINMIANLGSKNYNEFVQYSISDIDEMNSEMPQLIEAWKNGSSAHMLKQITEMKQKFPDMYQEILVDRNTSWVNKIETYLHDSTIEFVLFGALHLHGSEGVLEQLREKGYVVEQLKQ